MFAGASLDENSGAFCELKANFFRLILTKAELAGLTWDNVDFKNNMLTIDKTVNRYRKKTSVLLWRWLLRRAEHQSERFR